MSSEVNEAKRALEEGPGEDNAIEESANKRTKLEEPEVSTENNNNNDPVTTDMVSAIGTDDNRKLQVDNVEDAANNQVGSIDDVSDVKNTYDQDGDEARHYDNFDLGHDGELRVDNTNNLDIDAYKDGSIPQETNEILNRDASEEKIHNEQVNDGGVDNTGIDMSSVTNNPDTQVENVQNNNDANDQEAGDNNANVIEVLPLVDLSKPDLTNNDEQGDEQFKNESSPTMKDQAPQSYNQYSNSHDQQHLQPYPVNMPPQNDHHSVNSAYATSNGMDRNNSNSNNDNDTGPPPHAQHPQQHHMMHGGHVPFEYPPPYGMMMRSGGMGSYPGYPPPHGPMNPESGGSSSQHSSHNMHNNYGTGVGNAKDSVSGDSNSANKKSGENSSGAPSKGGPPPDQHNKQMMGPPYFPPNMQPPFFYPGFPGMHPMMHHPMYMPHPMHPNMPHQPGQQPGSHPFPHPKDMAGPPISRGISLAMACDTDQLSEYQILVRQQLELFEAQMIDAESNTQGRKKQIVLGQVGLRCRHCAHLPLRARGRGAVYYPTRLQGIYQAAQNMASSHLCLACQLIPWPVKDNIKKLRERRDNASGGKQYWADACRAMGIYETQQGLKMNSDMARGSNASSPAAPPPPPPPPPSSSQQPPHNV